jgi:hypothetical protein
VRCVLCVCGLLNAGDHVEYQVWIVKVLSPQQLVVSCMAHRCFVRFPLIFPAEFYLLSPPVVQDCTGKGCSGGGDIMLAVDQLTDHGSALTEAQDPYTSKAGGKCAYGAEGAPSPKGCAPIGNYPEPKPDENAIGVYLAQEGPLASYMDATHLQFYKGEADKLVARKFSRPRHVLLTRFRFLSILPPSRWYLHRPRGLFAGQDSGGSRDPPGRSRDLRRRGEGVDWEEQLGTHMGRGRKVPTVVRSEHCGT